MNSRTDQPLSPFTATWEAFLFRAREIARRIEEEVQTVLGSSALPRARRPANETAQQGARSEESGTEDRPEGP